MSGSNAIIWLGGLATLLALRLAFKGHPVGLACQVLATGFIGLRLCDIHPRASTIIAVALLFVASFSWLRPGY